MCYQPERLNGVDDAVRHLLHTHWYNGVDGTPQVNEVVLVWNNPQKLESVPIVGPRILKRHNNSRENRFRVYFPMDHGLEPGDLMNRYHPSILPKSRAILYFDDDGPFHPGKNHPNKFPSGFELWKRNSDAQVGCMARSFVSKSSRQQSLRHKVTAQSNEREWISHCRRSHDSLEYDPRVFSNFAAQMVLPSGSFLHSNYLCWLWHPALSRLRAFVRAHPVHPDDIVVSAVVSQWSGRGPATFTRRLRPGRRRRLLWKDVADWTEARSAAVDSITNYFGSFTWGSIGWCYKTRFFNETVGDCVPEFAAQGQSPWLNKGGYRNDICPG